MPVPRKITSLSIVILPTNRIRSRPTLHKQTTELPENRKCRRPRTRCGSKSKEKSATGPSEIARNSAVFSMIVVCLSVCLPSTCNFLSLSTAERKQKTPPDFSSEVSLQHFVRFRCSVGDLVGSLNYRENRLLVMRTALERVKMQKTETPSV